MESPTIPYSTSPKIIHDSFTFFHEVVLSPLGVSCGRPRLYGAAIIHGIKYTYGSFLAVTCPRGRRRKSAPFIFCRSDGTWTDNPECERL